MFKFKMWPVLATGFLLLSVGSYAIADDDDENVVSVEIEAINEDGYKFGPIADNEYGYKLGPIADNEDGHKHGSISCRVIHGSMFLFALRTASRTRASSSAGRALSSVISRSIHDATPRSAHAHDQD